MIFFKVILVAQVALVFSSESGLIMNGEDLNKINMFLKFFTEKHLINGR